MRLIRNMTNDAFAAVLFLVFTINENYFGQTSGKGGKSCIRVTIRTVQKKLVYQMSPVYSRSDLPWLT
jgi:hypothetical protein